MPAHFPLGVIYPYSSSPFKRRPKSLVWCRCYREACASHSCRCSWYPAPCSDSKQAASDDKPQREAPGLRAHPADCHCKPTELRRCFCSGCMILQSFGFYNAGCGFVMLAVSIVDGRSLHVPVGITNHCVAGRSSGANSRLHAVADSAMLRQLVSWRCACTLSLRNPLPASRVTVLQG